MIIFIRKAILVFTEGLYLKRKHFLKCSMQTSKIMFIVVVPLLFHAMVRPETFAVRLKIVMANVGKFKVYLISVLNLTCPFIKYFQIA